MTPDFQLGLQAAFRDLQNAGYFAQQIWQCCTTCGVAAVPKRYEKFIFYHEQDAVRLCEKDEVLLSWAGDAQQIIRAFRRNELTVEWNGDPGRKMCVSAAPGYRYVHPDDRVREGERAQ
jgi:hypothetical protein